MMICSANALFAFFAAFAVFGVDGFLDMKPGLDDPVGTYTLRFYTLPSAIAEIPGAPFKAVLFFLTLFFLEISSSFTLLDAMITTIADTHWGRKYYSHTSKVSAALATSFHQQHQHLNFNAL